MLVEMQQPLTTGPEPAVLDEPRSSPVRRCLASGERLPKEQLLRLVVGPDGALVPDLAERLPGRGLWILPRRQLVETAIKRRLFARAAKAPVGVPADLPDRLAELLRRRCLELVGLAKRAGALAVGHDQVRAVLTSGRAEVLLQPVDGSESECQRIASLGLGRRPDLVIRRLLTATELGEAVGRATAVHLAVTDARMAARLDRELRRLAEYEMPVDDQRPARATGAPGN